MHEAVSDVLDLRMREGDGLSRHVVVSLVAHGVAACGVRADAGRLARERSVQGTSTPMMISLGGGASGPNTGGMTQMSGASGSGGRAARAEAAAETPPAAKAPEMTIPDPTLKPKPKPSPKADKPVDKSAAGSRRRGRRSRRGDARAEHGRGADSVRRPLHRRSAAPAVCSSTSATSAAPSTSPR